jgi:hypothetical protein
MKSELLGGGVIASSSQGTLAVAERSAQRRLPSWQQLTRARNEGSDASQPENPMHRVAPCRTGGRRPSRAPAGADPWRHSPATGPRGGASPGRRTETGPAGERPLDRSLASPSALPAAPDAGAWPEPPLAPARTRLLCAWASGGAFVHSHDPVRIAGRPWRCPAIAASSLGRHALARDRGLWTAASG